jgi:hypothetical protein
LASKEQAMGIREINSAMSQLDSATQKNSSVAQQGAAQSAELKAEAEALAGAFVRLVEFVEGDRNFKGQSLVSGRRVEMKTPRAMSHHAGALAASRDADGVDVYRAS